ncbi:Crp/Fnr family transcriptional regulator [Orenia metallireducens]|uniref:Crp/Fnr family transcriptional regulator n=1 Tax=Orenia metallireducens TaxID=1413210 RepID=A0A1C0A846_9FIRM|nr:Crp/Fnr family transcriptional regulator [Orenia metallireducens]OCL26390.1 Crp/Fnr family transcriptional regulator [Orenia metallireducens]
MVKCCNRCKNKLCASKVPIFSNLAEAELIDIIKMTGHEEFEKGDTICFEGLEANTLYIINEGEIKLFKCTKDGKEQILHILTAGDFFGELNLLKGGQYSFSAEAITSTKLCTLTKDKMKSIILDKPEIALKIMETLADRVNSLETLAQNLATNEVEVRLAYMLLKLKKEYGVETPQGIEMKIPITREDMSNYTGVARETVSRKLKSFEEEGIIKLVGNKKIIILDEERLRLMQ